MGQDGVVAGTAPLGDKGSMRGWLHSASRGTHPTPEPGCLPFLEGHLPPSRPGSAQPEKVLSKQLLQAAGGSSRLCLGVFTRVTVRVCLDRASQGRTSQTWSHTGGGLWERGAGWVSGSPLI